MGGFLSSHLRPTPGALGSVVTRVWAGDGQGFIGSTRKVLAPWRPVKICACACFSREGQLRTGQVAAI